MTTGPRTLLAAALAAVTIAAGLGLAGPALLRAEQGAAPEDLVTNDELGRESHAPDERGVLAILVLDGSGKPVGGAAYDVLSGGRPVFLTLAPRETGPGGQADVRLPDGSYDVVAGKGSAGGRATATVRRGETSRVTVTLR